MFKPIVVAAFAALPLGVGYADSPVTENLHTNTYQEFLNVSCKFEGDCAVPFPATQHSETQILAVSCSMSLPAGTSIAYASLGSTDASPSILLQPFYLYTNGGYNYYGISATTNLFIFKGDTPQVDVLTGGGGAYFLQCTISGFHS